MLENLAMPDNLILDSTKLPFWNIINIVIAIVIEPNKEKILFSPENNCGFRGNLLENADSTSNYGRYSEAIDATHKK